MSSSQPARVFVRAPRGRGIQPATLRRAVAHALAKAAPGIAGDVSVVVVSDRTIRQLNRRYRGTDAATDVLAFPIGDGTRTGEPFGDIVISLETARRQARGYGASLSDELTRLVLHGALHLCGYDHHERKQAARMHRLARRLFAEVDVRA